MLRTTIALALAAVGFAATAQAATRTVTIRDLDFKPATVRINKGDTVRWRFRDGTTPHNVTSRGSRRFRSSSSRQSGTYSVRFTKAGTYRYVCTIHPNMRGKIVVG